MVGDTTLEDRVDTGRLEDSQLTEDTQVVSVDRVGTGEDTGSSSSSDSSLEVRFPFLTFSIGWCNLTDPCHSVCLFSVRLR